MNRFEGKVVIVTAAGSGIGAGTARRFLQEGASVVLNHHTGFVLAYVLETCPGAVFESCAPVAPSADQT